ncbi:DUF167 domain-containing protein [Candidatus Dependentiae bacterium]|nr:DUF167 domain-containing protein [Candidatus Dependentiae bacterium]
MSLVFDLKVFPQSGRQRLVLDKSGILKCYILSAPEDGKANKEIIDFLAKLLDLRKQDIEIIGGLLSRKKKMMIQGMLTYEEFLGKVGLENQKTIF